MTPELTHLKTLVTSSLETHLPTNSDIAQPIVDAMRHAVLGGGKRIRPMLACAACHALGGDLASALPAGCAVEFIHSYSLVHDDLPAMDNDELRHGLPSAHVAFGEANAILAGDSLHSLAFQTIAMSDEHNVATRLAMIDLLAQAAGWSGMAGGQCLDIAAEGRNLSFDELKALHAAKTGALIRVSVQIGALAAKPTPPSDGEMALLAEFGDRIGLAFQVMDDVLDVTQTTDRLGKPAGSDEGLQKNTFPRLMGVKQAQALAYELFDEAQSILNRSQLDTSLLGQLAQLIVDRDH